MSTDQSLKQAVANLETAWRRLREVLDGPDVAAALVGHQAGPRPMSNAPRDGTRIECHAIGGGSVVVRWSGNRLSWRDSGSIQWDDDSFVGWSPVK